MSDTNILLQGGAILMLAIGAYVILRGIFGTLVTGFLLVAVPLLWGDIDNDHIKAGVTGCVGLPISIA